MMLQLKAFLRDLSHHGCLPALCQAVAYKTTVFWAETSDSVAKNFVSECHACFSCVCFLHHWLVEIVL